MKIKSHLPEADGSPAYRGDYFESVAYVFTGQPYNKELSKEKRKYAWVSLANVSDAFTRMLSEPKSKRRDSKEVHRFVVLSHMLVSHMATLSK